MKLDELIQASSRPGWIVRLIAYIALVVTLSFIVQLVHAW